ncbi:multidrug transporter [Spirochaetia bacterium]|nr:multidrug transporter [Spirochaetia bacterium]
MPFISIASNPSILDIGKYKQVFDFIGIQNKNSFTIAFGFLIIIFYFFRSFYNISYTYLSTKYARSTYKYFSGRLFKTYLTIPYNLYVQKNTSDFINIIMGEANNLSLLVLAIIQISSEFFTVLLLYLFIVFVNWQMTLILTGVLLLITLIILNIFVRKTKIQGIKKSESQRKVHRILEETFGNFKFIKLKGNEKQIFQNFESSTIAYSRAETISETIGIVPKNILENMGFTLLIATVIFIIWRYNSADQIIPIISMYALALYRILPAIFKILQNINKMVYLQHSLNVVYDNMTLPTEKEENNNLDFEKSINIGSVSFNYVPNVDVLENISLTINKGEKIAISGESGSGKSTLVDLIIGIQKPASGIISIDNTPITNENIRSWRSKIGYIPQNIYLFDDTVANNICFGSEYDENQIINVLKKANIWDFLSQKQGIHTMVGEGGNHLSGGQKQRIGIARALYCNPEILVLDEATSSLDYETEAKIMEEIYFISKDKTLIVIAHRTSTLKGCDRIINIENHKIRS